MYLIQDLINGDYLNFMISLFAYAVIIVLLIPVHEFSHAFTAYKLGDGSQKWLGRLTLNPAKHNDWQGLIFFILVGFGWGRPVSVNPNNFKMKNKRLGMAITAAAGPISNIIFAFVAILLQRIAEIFYRATLTTPALVLYYLLMVVAQLSLSLAIFNLIPIAPLDGSKIFGLFFPAKVLEFCERYSLYLTIALLVIIRFTFVGDLFSIVSTWIYNGMYFIIDLPFKLLGV